MSGSLSAPPRFVAVSLVDGQPIVASHSIRKVLETAADLASFGIGHHPRTEVLDCDGEAEAVRRGEMRLAGARERFATVYRAERADGLPPIPILADRVPHQETTP